MRYERDRRILNVIYSKINTYLNAIMSYWFPYLNVVTSAELSKCPSDSTIHHLLQVTLHAPLAPRTTTTDISTISHK